MEQFQEFISHWITTFYLYLDPHLVERPRVLDDRAQTYQVLLGVFCLALLALYRSQPLSVAASDVLPF